MAADRANKKVRSTVEEIRAARIVPIVTIDDAARSDELAAALLRGGITSVEITLRTPEGLAAVSAFAVRGDILVGAGTVLTPEQVEEAAGRGAQFVSFDLWEGGKYNVARSSGLNLISR
ncbi:hypothetical protein [Glaciihabitans sp. UYNi722]|uniref:hypothetical protein n=1 Tax=Glaciihabitans sp. UYNi722 TaxID=3156344 RepID=UPI00339487AC